MNLLIAVAVSGMAVGFSTELVGTILERFTSFSAGLVKQTLSAPFGALYLWLLGTTGWTLLVGAFAAGFLALIVMYWLNRPVQIQQVMSRRLP